MRFLLSFVSFINNHVFNIFIFYFIETEHESPINNSLCDNESVCECVGMCTCAMRTVRVCMYALIDGMYECAVMNVSGRIRTYKYIHNIQHLHFTLT